MNIDDMILVSVDDHVIEPAHLFEGRVPKKYEDKAPRFVRRDDGTMAWRYNGREILNTALNAVAGQAVAQRTNDRDGASHSGLVVQLCAHALGGVEELGAVGCQKRLVCGDDV